MKKFTLILLLACIGFLYSCGDDKSTDPNKSAYACEMTVIGDVNLEFKTNDVLILPPGDNEKNARITIKMVDSDGAMHQLYMVLDGDALILPENEFLTVDLSRGESQATFMYDFGNSDNSKIYRVTQGEIELQDFSFTRAKGTFSFTANLVGNSDLVINVNDGKIDFKK